MNKGIFISFEGPDGSGKTTQINLLRSHLEKNGYKVLVTREPGGTAISEKIRAILLDPKNKEMDGVTEALLYAASRAQHVAEKIRPALDEGVIVLCDRFMDSSIAYQGYGRGLGDDVRVINEFAVQGYSPDITFFMNLKASEGIKRVDAQGSRDRLELEALDFHDRVYRGYLALSEIYKSRYVNIDAAKSIEEISEEIAAKVDAFLNK